MGIRVDGCFEEKRPPHILRPADFRHVLSKKVMGQMICKPLSWWKDKKLGSRPLCFAHAIFDLTLWVMITNYGLHRYVLTHMGLNV